MHHCLWFLLLENCYWKRNQDKIKINSYTVTKQVPNFIESVGLRRISLHSLRHSCGSILLANGVHMKEIQAWLRHSSYNTTANRYTHLDTKTKENTANAANSIFGNRKSA